MLSVGVTDTANSILCLPANESMVLFVDEGSRWLGISSSTSTSSKVDVSRFSTVTRMEASTPGVMEVGASIPRRMPPRTLRDDHDTSGGGPGPADGRDRDRPFTRLAVPGMTTLTRNSELAGMVIVWFCEKMD